MNDDPAFDDPAFDDLRALLAETRATGPVPDDVAARLDATLASLQAERAASTGADQDPAVVLPLRRRLAPRLLVAAAAVAVIATGSVGIAQVLDGTSGNDAMTAESATSDDDAGAGSAEPAAPRSGGPEELSSGDTAYASTPVQLSSATFARDAARVMRTAAAASKAEAPADDGLDTGSVPGSDPLADRAAPTAPPLTATTGRLDTLLRQALEACPGPEAPGAVTLSATLDEAPVALVFRPPTQTGQLVEAWSCDGTRLLESATVER